MLWENNSLRIRDIHLFNEAFPDVYTTQVATENECSFFTLPIVDGYIWSKKDQIAGLRLKAVIDGKEILLEGKDPKFTQTQNNVHISWPLTTVNGSLEIDLNEKSMTIKLTGKASINWYLNLNTADNASLPFTGINPKQIDCSFEGMKYKLQAVKGSFSKPDTGAVLRITPQMNVITISF